MTRRMSCSMTIDAVRARTKTVTRRHVNTWKNLKVGDRLTLIEKGMGLPQGAHQVVLAEVEIVDVRVEPIGRILDEDDGTELEGLGDLGRYEFIAFWLRSHGYGAQLSLGMHHLRPDAVATLCRRIEWRYLDEVPDAV